MNKALPRITESLDELEALLRREKKPRRKERLQLLYLLQAQKARSREQLARVLGKHRNTIARWLDRYEEGGRSALLDVYEPAGQRGQRTLPEPVFEALAHKLDQAEGFGGYMQLQGWLKAEFDLEVPYGTLRGIVRRHFGAKLKVARPVHVKKTLTKRRLFPSS